jgi:hypothetical protein
MQYFYDLLEDKPVNIEDYPVSVQSAIEIALKQSQTNEVIAHETVMKKFKP